MPKNLNTTSVSKTDVPDDNMLHEQNVMRAIEIVKAANEERIKKILEILDA